MKNKKVLSFILTIAVIAASLSAFLCLPTMTAEAATHTVTSTADSGAGSLRQAIADAATGDTIEFANGIGTINLQTEIAFNKTLTIDGGGRITLDGRGQNRIFRVNGAGNPLTLRGLTIRNGNEANGGGVYSGGVVTAENCTFSGNTVVGMGGGLYAVGSVTATNCTFAGNMASAPLTGGVGGGGLYTQTSLTAESCIFSGNRTVSESEGKTAPGGGAYAGQSVTAKNCKFYDNEAAGESGGYGHGGGIYVGGSFTAENCTFTRNTAAHWGSAIHTQSILAINSIFTGNRISMADNMGSVNDSSGFARFYHCTLADNNGREKSALLGAGYTPYYRNSIQTPSVGAIGAAKLYNNAGTALTTIGGNTVTHASIFGTGKADANGILKPLNSSIGGIAYKTTTALTAANLTADGLGTTDANNVISTLANDIQDDIRSSPVSYGAVETPQILVESIEILYAPTSAPVGTPLTLMVRVLPENAEDKTVTWSSSDPTIATVNNGFVLTQKPGTVTITATANDGSGQYGTCTITVLPVLVESVTISANAPKSMKVGDTATVTATVLPENATNKTVEWKTWPADTKVAKVDQNGKVTALAPGEVVIMAMPMDGGEGHGDSYDLTVTSTSVPVTKIALSGAPASMFKGDTATIKATVTPTNATNKAVTWSSSATGFATVSTSGVVTAKAAGSVTITATAKDGSGVKATCKITVTNPVTKIALSGAPENMIKGNTATVKATVTPTDATNKAMTWSSSATAIATVSASGVVTAKEPGKVTITATAKDGSGKKASATITVHSYVTLRLNKTKAIQNGVKTTIDDVGTKPFTIGGKTMLPIRFVSEKLGAKVTFISDSQPITVKYGNITVEFKLNSKQMKIIEGGKTTTITLEVAAQLVDGKTYIPLRALGQSLGFHIYYDADTEIIVVNNPDMTTAVRNERLAEGKAYIK